MFTSRFHLEATLWLPLPRETVFDCFTDARNLELLTPPELSLEMMGDGPEPMRAGLIVDYRLRLLRLIPLRWRASIDVFEPPVRFVDRQLHGPYLEWTHEHSFQEHEGGTLCVDRVDFRSPGPAWIAGPIMRLQLGRTWAVRGRALRKLLEISSDVDCPETFSLERCGRRPSNKG